MGIIHLYCFRCKQAITESKYAKVVEVREERGGYNTLTEYANPQEEIYVHLNCLLGGNTQILCQAQVKDENSLIRNNLLGFLNE